MKIKKTYKVNQLRDYSSLFMRSEVNRILKNDLKSIDIKIRRYDPGFLNKRRSYLKYFEYLYKVLQEFYPNEYLLKNEFLNKWLIAQLGGGRSVIFNEFRIGGAIADLAMFNGTSKCFEIKTILDKEFRLSGQLIEYQKIFNEIYIIVPTVKLNKYSQYAEEAGIITYDDDQKIFTLVKEAKFNNSIDTNSIMQVLHTHEYKAIVYQYFGCLPITTSFDQFELCQVLIEKIPMPELNNLFISAMKNRKVNNIFFKEKSKELNQVCLSMNLNKNQIEKLMTNLTADIT